MGGPGREDTSMRRCILLPRIPSDKKGHLHVGYLACLKVFLVELRLSHVQE